MPAKKTRNPRVRGDRIPPDQTGSEQPTQPIHYSIPDSQIPPPDLTGTIGTMHDLHGRDEKRICGRCKFFEAGPRPRCAKSTSNSEWYATFTATACCLWRQAPKERLK